MPVLSKCMVLSKVMCKHQTHLYEHVCHKSSFDNKTSTCNPVRLRIVTGQKGWSRVPQRAVLLYVISITINYYTLFTN